MREELTQLIDSLTEQKEHASVVATWFDGSTRSLFHGESLAFAKARDQLKALLDA